ncbi:MAG TPA: Rid family hydrolase, partial [Luteimonas sp.]|nr:Rid family hydrolase [Luteimonas sp.]
MTEAVHAQAAPKPVGHYPHARRVGDLLFLSGIGPRDPATDAIPGNETFADGRVRSYDIAAQTRAVFANVRAVLEASGARWEDLV